MFTKLDALQIISSLNLSAHVIATSCFDGKFVIVPRRATRVLSKLVFFQPSVNTIQDSLDFPKLPHQQAPGSLAGVPATAHGSCFCPLIWRMNCAAAELPSTNCCCSTSSASSVPLPLICRLKTASAATSSFTSSFFKMQ